MPVPSNLTALTAIDLGTLPASVSQDVHDAGTTYTVWYKYTAVATEKVVALFGFGDLTIYRPRTVVYIGPAAAPVAWLNINHQNKPVQFPVVAGTTYYFEFQKINNNSPAVLLIEAQTAPVLPVPLGSVFINDEVGGNGFPAAFLSSVDGSILNFMYPCVAGEAGDVLPGGAILLSDETLDVLMAYDAQLNFITSPAPFAFTANPKIRACNAGNKWYVGHTTGGALVGTVLANGAVGPLTWAIPGSATTNLRALAANNAETILYFTGGTGLDSPVGRFDLIGSVVLSDLAATVAGHLIVDILVLADDTILVSYFDGSPPRALFVRHYNPAGAILNTYTFGSATMGQVSPRLAYALDDPTSFWVWFHPNTPAGVSAIQNVRVSDGAILTAVTASDYVLGEYAPAETATPLDRVGMSQSCPFMLLRAAITTTNNDDTIEVDDGGAGSGCPISLNPGTDGGSTAGCLPTLSPGTDGGSTAGCAAVL